MKIITILIVSHIMVGGEAYQASIPFDSAESCANAIEPAWEMWASESPDLMVQCKPTGAPSTSIRPQKRVKSNG